MERNELYDKIIAVLIQNIIAERNRCGKLILWNFFPNNPAHRLYFNVAAIVADFKNEPIYIDTTLIDYLKLRISKKKRKNLRLLTPWRAKGVPPDFQTTISTILEFVKDHFQIDENLYEAINNEYYGWN